jgi:poly(A) polymerase
MSEEPRDEVSAAGAHEPVIRQRQEHAISRKHISEHALKVLYRLQNSGYTAYLVGGGVRDLLLGRTPKDFDVSTNAHPGEIKKLFRNCWLIGKRFRLAHIKFGKTVIETSTFRKPPPPEEGDEEDKELIVHDDNTFGTAEEDAWRRDFTINGLFYDPGEFTVIDYVGGLEDLEARRIHTIGDPDVRFREDPVRMLRAIRFAARLDFTVEEETWQALLRHRAEIEKAAPPRLLEEVYRLFAYGAGEQSIRLLRQSGMLGHLLPVVDNHLDAVDEAEADRYFAYLRKLDRYHDGCEEVNQALTFSTLLYPIVRRAAGRDEGSRYNEKVRQLLQELGHAIPVPKRLRETVSLVLNAQDRFTAKRRRRFNKTKFVQRPFFPDAIALHAFAVKIEGLRNETCRRWREFAHAQGVDLGAAEDFAEEAAPGSTESSQDSAGEGSGAQAPRAETGDEEHETETSPQAEQPEKKSRSSRRRGGRRRKRKKTSSSGEGAEEDDRDAATEESPGAEEPSNGARAEEDADGRQTETAGEAEEAGPRSPKSRRSRRSRRRKKKSRSTEESEGETAEPQPAEADKKPGADAQGFSAEQEAERVQEEPEKEGLSRKEAASRRQRRAWDTDGRHRISKADRIRQSMTDVLTEAEAQQVPHWLDEL